MASTIFIDGATPILAAWLNDVNNLVYNGVLPSSPTITGNLTVNGTSLFKSKVSITLGGLTQLTLASSILEATNSTNNYLSYDIQNQSAGIAASTDFVATANNGTDTTNYVNLGINSSGWATGSWTINGADDGYLYASDGNLSIGTAGAKYLSFFTGGTLAANERARITSAGNLLIGTTTDDGVNKLQVNGGVTASTINGGQQAGFRNRIINGAHLVNQRPTGALGTNSYTSDRWAVNYSGTAPTWTVSTGSQGWGYGNALGVIGVAGNTGANIHQKIEAKNSWDLAGQTVTLSYWVYNSTGASFTCTSSFYYATATDNFASTTAIATGVGGTTCPNAAWTKVSVTQAIPSAATTGLDIVLVANTPAVTAGNTIYVGLVQLELGSVATPFEQRSIGTELSLCQRYLYYISLFTQFMGQQESATLADFVVPLPQVLRTATPTLTMTTNGTISNALGGTIAVTAWTLQTAGSQTCRIRSTMASGGVAGQASFTTGDQVGFLFAEL